MIYFQAHSSSLTNNTIMSNLAEHLDGINTRLNICLTRLAGSQSVQKPVLLAVSKGQSAQQIREAYQLGLHRFGENYLQEALQKMAVLTSLDIEWHFIGPIQSNKCKAIAEHFCWVQSLDRIKIAEKLNQYCPADKILNVCVQINIDDEKQKSGIRVKELEDFCTRLSQLPHLRLRGLMAIPKVTESVSEQRQSFANIAKVFKILQTTYVDIDTLSMGMSDDFELACEQGSTMIRLGTALFGKRR